MIHNPSAITLIQNSGIQFLDFALSPAATAGKTGNFVRQSANGPLLRLDYCQQSGKFTLPGLNDGETEIVRPEKSYAHDYSLQVLDGVWLPLPCLRVNAGHCLTDGPANWVRMQLRRLDTPDAAGNTVHMTLAFDTRIADDAGCPATLAPGADDVRNGVHFALAMHNCDVSDFLDQTWVDGWLREIFIQFASQQEGRSENDLASAMKTFEYQAHYLNLLEILVCQLQVPEVKLIGETPHTPAIPVDLVLDVGNTHTCGILTEDHGEQNSGLNQSTELRIRSLSEPHRISEALFSSYLEFSEAKFGKANFSMESGREQAFIWPSMARTGEEALRLATRRSGSDGASGLSSPRRYLWDDSPARQPWRFGQSTNASHRELPAMAMPLTNLIDDDGQPLYCQPLSRRLPVFTPLYSRSSLMTQMLCELLAQALSQINSVAHRRRMGLPASPRQLRQLILTLPSAMPKQEREIFHRRMQEAIALVWKGMGWHPHDDALFPDGAQNNSSVPLPGIHMEWDEATCGQLVWLYNEVQRHYAGHSGECFRNLARPDRLLAADEPPGSTLRCASIDIGGGTTDMAITQYQLDDGVGSNVKIIPRLLFREGFKLAGDDILLDVIQLCVLPAIEQAMHAAGIADPQTAMTRLFGDAGHSGNRQILRQQTTLQILIPLGQAILARWEQSDSQNSYAPLPGRIGEWLPDAPTENVLNYLQQTLAPEAAAFNLLDVPLQVDIQSLDDALHSGRMSLAAPLKSLCEVIHHYCCDVLLITGRPASLPGVKALVRALQPVPAKRLLWLDSIPVHERLPFAHQGRMVNPKTSAALGAMLCSLAKDLRLPGFNFKTADIQAYSTVRHLGVLDGSPTLSAQNVWYQDVDLDDPQATLDTSRRFVLRGNATLGFRQLEDERWPASALYQLRINSPELAKDIAAAGTLSVSLRYDPPQGGFALAGAWMQDGTPVALEQLSLKLNTLAGGDRRASHYWIDSGNVYLK
ncbi:virulence factor SrfB [Entomohabitans teleogrylli]|uniref:virulence factor SrfB n=1 Tax=Entomohabitans teleogrylli TaxID=1384589 RepID=UPI00073D72A1|nr:virulence factor SrfB [Entomohabitans teleogrylli]